MKNYKLKADTSIKAKHSLPLYGIFGILSLFVLVSIAYSTYMVAVGTDGVAPKVMLVPQALFAACLAIYKFSTK
jgi:hypothetical protein